MKWQLWATTEITLDQRVRTNKLHKKNLGGSAGSNGNFMSCTPSAEYKDMEMTAF